MRKQLTLCIVHQHPRILLGMKKRGFGAGRWNGFGGKVAPGETIEQAARRELAEESGLEAVHMEKQGIIEFEFEKSAENTENLDILEVHIFKVHEYSGQLTETEEMKPQWFDAGEIPFREMWPDDLYWVPLFIKGRRFRGRFIFDRPSTLDRQSKILERRLEEVADLG